MDWAYFAVSMGLLRSFCLFQWQILAKRKSFPFTKTKRCQQLISSMSIMSPLRPEALPPQFVPVLLIVFIHNLSPFCKQNTPLHTQGQPLNSCIPILFIWLLLCWQKCGLLSAYAEEPRDLPAGHHYFHPMSKQWIHHRFLLGNSPLLRNAAEE